MQCVICEVGIEFSHVTYMDSDFQIASTSYTNGHNVEMRSPGILRSV